MVSLGVVRWETFGLGTFVWDLWLGNSFGRACICGSLCWNFHLGTAFGVFAWEIAFGNSCFRKLRIVTFVWGLSFENRRFRTSLGIPRLEIFVWKPSFGKLRLPSFGNLRYETFVWGRELGHGTFRLRAFVWKPSVGKFRLGIVA
jgi:hypothetical protein